MRRRPHMRPSSLRLALCLPLRVPHYPSGSSPLFAVFCSSRIRQPALISPPWVRPFAYGVLSPCTTMASSDFSRQALFQPRSARALRVRETSQDKNVIFPSMHPSRLHPTVPCSYWTLTCLAALSLSLPGCVKSYAHI